MRCPMVAGNWKMYKTRKEAEAFVQTLREQIKAPLKVEVVICPPYTLLETVGQARQTSPFKLGAQNVHWQEQGAFTGEIAPAMLQDLDCAYVICGHSERRQFFGETDATVNRRLKAALKAGLNPIFCLGETLEEREKGITFSVCVRQLQKGLEGLTEEQISGLVIAYEPVWAIGTGRNATPLDAQQVLKHLRVELGAMYGSAKAEQVRFLYGGSVKPENIRALMAEPDLDGVLVGGASLDAVSFAQIIQGT